MKKFEQYAVILGEVAEIRKLESYHRIFLTTMILRKLRHPEENVNEIVKKTMKKMTIRYTTKLDSDIDLEEVKIREIGRKSLKKGKFDYGKSEVVAVSFSRCMEDLEEALDEAILPQAIKRNGYVVRNTLEYFVEKVRQKMELYAEECAEEMAEEVMREVQNLPNVSSKEETKKNFQDDELAKLATEVNDIIFRG